MLPALARMRRSAEFSATVRHGRRAGSSSVTVHLADPVDAGTPHVGFVVSRSVGSAVARNRVRRRLRHLMRARLVQLPRGARLVVRAQPAAATASSAALAADLDRALARATTTAPRSRP